MMEEILNNKWLKVGLLAVAGLILAGGLVWAGYWYGINSNLKSQMSKLPILTQNLTPIENPAITPTSIPNPTADWKSYRSQGYGFTFKYPTEFSIESQTQTNKVTDQPTVFVSFSKSNAVVENYPDFAVVLVKTAMTAEEWIGSKDYCPKSFDSCTPQRASPIPRSIQFDSINRHYAAIDTFFKNGEILYDVSVGARAGNEPISNEVRNIYNLILSTFRFLE